MVHRRDLNLTVLLYLCWCVFVCVNAMCQWPSSMGVTANTVVLHWAPQLSYLNRDHRSNPELVGLISYLPIVCLSTKKHRSLVTPIQTTCLGLYSGVFVRIKDKNLHVECFRCATCGSSLKNQGYFNIHNKLYCDVHAKLIAMKNPPPGTEGYVPVPIKP